MSNVHLVPVNPVAHQGRSLADRYVRLRNPVSMLPGANTVARALGGAERPDPGEGMGAAYLDCRVRVH